MTIQKTVSVSVASINTAGKDSFTTNIGRAQLNQKEIVILLGGAIVNAANQIKAAKTVEEQSEIYNAFRSDLAKAHKVRPSVYFERAAAYLNESMTNARGKFDKENDVFVIRLKKDAKRCTIKLAKINVWDKPAESGSKDYTVEEQQAKALLNIERNIKEAIKLGCKVDNKVLAKLLAQAKAK